MKMVVETPTKRHDCAFTF